MPDYLDGQGWMARLLATDMPPAESVAPSTTLRAVRIHIIAKLDSLRSPNA
jgi:hypothetical protein